MRLVGDLDAVVLLVVLAHHLQHGDGLLGGRLVDQHRLEAPLQRRILLDVLAILVERRRADAAQLATRQRWLEQIGRANRALRRARTDDGMQLVDEEDDVRRPVAPLRGSA